MGRYTSWVHGNALVPESSENIIDFSHFGWGTDVTMKPGKGTWFHVPLPTPAIIDGLRAKVTRVFLLYETDSVTIRQVHIYDGPWILEEQNSLQLFKGDFRKSIVPANTYTLKEPRTVRSGIGISFFVLADASFGLSGGSEAPPTQFSIAAAGAEFSVLRYNILVAISKLLGP